MIFKRNGKKENLSWIEQNLKQDAEDEENAADGMEKLQKQLLCLHWAEKIIRIHESFNFSCKACWACWVSSVLYVTHVTDGYVVDVVDVVGSWILTHWSHNLII